MEIFKGTYNKFWGVLSGKNVGSLEGLAFAAGAIGIQLCHIDKRVIRIEETRCEKVLDWFLSLKTGLYIIVCGVHAISVDFDRSLIFDCGCYYALHLSRECLAYCGVHYISKMRKIQLPHHLITMK